MDKNEILRLLAKESEIEQLLSGDYWLRIEHKNYKNGLDINIEKTCEEDYNENNEIFNLSAYKLLETEIGELEADMDFTEIQFCFTRKELELLDKNMPH